MFTNVVIVYSCDLLVLYGVFLMTNILCTTVTIHLSTVDCWVVPNFLILINKYLADLY